MRSIRQTIYIYEDLLSVTFLLTIEASVPVSDGERAVKFFTGAVV